jgi:hypothetical protein
VTINTDCSTAAVPIHGVVEFVPADFRALYPQFTDPPTNDAQLLMYFTLATIILNNSCKSVVSNATFREQLLNLLVAHITTLVPLAANSGGGTGPGLIGAITEAHEGTVGVSAGWLGEVSQSMAWFIQTPFGQLFWQLTSPYRSFRYVPPPACCTGFGNGFMGRRG